MNIKEARRKTGISQQEMSDLLGIPKRTIENWESGKANPPSYVEKLVIKELLSRKGNINMTKLTIKTYHSNATVFGNDIWHDVRYDGDTLQMYGDDTIFENEAEALEEYKSDLTEELEEVFPDAENIDDIVDTIMIYASDCISVMWDK